MSSPDFLNHRTVETGDVRRSPRSEIEPDVLAAMAGLIAARLEDGGPVELGAGWRGRFREAEGGDVLEARLWAAGMELEGPPAVRLRVEIRPGLAPMLTASMAGVIRAPDPARASFEAVDLGLYVAWAWLTRRDPDGP